MMNQIDQQLNADLLRLSEIYKQETYTEAQITEASTIISNLQDERISNHSDGGYHLPHLI